MRIFVHYIEHLGYLFLVLLLLQAGCGEKTSIRVVVRGEKDGTKADREAVLAEEVAALRGQEIAAEAGEALKRFQRFLDRHEAAEPSLRAPALKRAGDLYMKAAHRQFLDEMEVYETDPNGPLPLVDYRKAIDAYTELIRDHGDYPENDQALYALSRAYAESGERDRALPLLERLVSAYPTSPHRLEAYFRLGEYYFDHASYEKAAAAYSQAASWDDPFFKDKALYKLGWTYFNLGDYPKAVERFLSVIDRKTSGMPLFKPEEGSLVWEALTYVANSFRNLGGPSEAASYFQKNGNRRYASDLYLMMGNQYMVEGEPQRGIETYDAFIASHPLDPMAPFFAAYVMEAYKKRMEQKAERDARIRLVQEYGYKSSWYQANDEAARERTRPLIKSELHHLALSAHARAQKENKKGDYQQAAGWYRRYLEEFPFEEGSLEIQFLLGEALMAVEVYAEAGAAYEIAAYGNSNMQTDRRAAYAAVVAYEKVPTLEGEKQFIALSKRFVSTFPKDSESPVVLFNAADRLFEKGKYPEAAEILDRLLIAYPTHKTTTIARKLIAHSYMKGGDYQKAGRSYAQALAHLPRKDKKEKKDLSELMATAIYKEAEQLREKDQLAEAAERFRSVSQEVEESPLASESLFEAASLFEKLGQTERAISIYLTIHHKYAKSELAEKATVHAGLLYEQQGKPLQAAAVFVDAAKMTKDDLQAQKLLWSAGLHYEKAENWKEIVNTFLRFIRRFSKHPDAPEALFKMAQARKNQGREKAAAKLYQAVIDRGPLTVFAAKARFQQAENSFKSFKAIRLKEPLDKNFKKKTQALKTVVDLYTKSVESRHIDVVTFSAFRLGEVFEHFKSALLNAELPNNLNDEQLEEYRFQLEEKAYPFEEKAITAYESNVHRVQQTNGLFTEWVKKSYDRLSDLRPARYRRKERTERIVSNINVGVLTAEEHRETVAKRK